MIVRVVLVLWSATLVTAFAPMPLRSTPTTTTSKVPLTKHAALWRHLVDTNGNNDESDSNSDKNNNGSTNNTWITNPFRPSLAIAGLLVSAAPVVCEAVSGGGLDYANIDITGQDFSKGNYKGKDFTQVIAKNTLFMGSNLQGCRFYKAYLVSACMCD